jgi:hypothetical protein
MNVQKLHSCELDAALADVTVANVALGARVRRGRTWNKAWRDDVDTSSAACPRPRLAGTVVGYTDAGGKLVGENSGRQFDTDRITESSGAGWAVVEWDAPSRAGKRSVYPVGAMGAHSLAFAQLDTVAPWAPVPWTPVPRTPASWESWTSASCTTRTKSLNQSGPAWTSSALQMRRKTSTSSADHRTGLVRPLHRKSPDMVRKRRTVSGSETSKIEPAY